MSMSSKRIRYFLFCRQKATAQRFLVLCILPRVFETTRAGYEREEGVVLGFEQGERNNFSLEAEKECEQGVGSFLPLVLGRAGDWDLFGHCWYQLLLLDTGSLL